QVDVLGELAQGLEAEPCRRHLALERRELGFEAELLGFELAEVAQAERAELAVAPLGELAAQRREALVERLDLVLRAVELGRVRGDPRVASLQRLDERAELRVRALDSEQSAQRLACVVDRRFGALAALELALELSDLRQVDAPADRVDLALGALHVGA